jgi:hypothetical protein
MKGPVTEGLEDAQIIKKSPLAEGGYNALKGALLGIPSGYAIGRLSGGSGPAGAFIGGLLAAAAFGATGAIGQDLQNKEQEAELRVHLENLKSREPFFYMPPRHLFAREVNRVR